MVADICSHVAPCKPTGELIFAISSPIFRALMIDRSMAFYANWLPRLRNSCPPSHARRHGAEEPSPLVSTCWITFSKPSRALKPRSLLCVLTRREGCGCCFTIAQRGAAGTRGILLRVATTAVVCNRVLKPGHEVLQMPIKHYERVFFSRCPGNKVTSNRNAEKLGEWQ